VRGDRVEIVVDTGDGSVRQFDMVATKAGRRVEVAMTRGTVEVTEVTRSGQPVRSARFMASRVVALVEHPAGDASEGEGGGQRSGGARRRGNPDQPSLELG
jgi:hypothetical protein